DVDRETPGLLRIDGNFNRTLPRIIGLLNHLDVGTSNLADVDTAADKQIHVKSVLVLDIGPSRHHEQGSWNVADAAWADMPQRALGVHQRIGVTVTCSLEGDASEQSVIHRLLVQVGVLRIVVGQVELVLKKHQAATGA